MAGIAEKLYPPVIAGSIPAFYSDNGTAIIAVPFSMNKAVGYNDIAGFKLKIKTAQSNTYLTTLSAQKTGDDLTDRIVHFQWREQDEGFNKIKIGQFLKIQLAYYDENETIGYYSTVGTIKYTSKPSVSFVLNESNQTQFQGTYYGKYETGLDKSERPYSYIFSLYDRWEKTLIETSGWKLHNSTIKNSNEDDLSSTYDSYTFETSLIKNQIYYIQYGVKTINNLEIYTPLLSCMDTDTGITDIHSTLYVENMFDNGYIKLFFDENSFQDREDFNRAISIEVSRAEKTDGYNSWRVIKKAYFSNLQKVLDWSFKDFTIEQGMWYKYSFRQYDENGNHTTLCVAKDIKTGKEEIFADFEDMFLWDGERQLKIRFNPKMSSFKTTLLESKIDTIGSRYPFIFRNGSVAYKEFPISGLISYLADENSLFLNHITDLDIYMADTLVRDGSPSDETQYLQTSTINLAGYNISAERKFKIKVLDWLNNGKIKLFRSPTEGNYLVRLLNVSLSPEDKLSRMLHTFSATAYEMEEFSYKNLLELGIIKIEEVEEEKIYTESVSLAKLIRQNANKIEAGESIKINAYQIINFLSLKTTSGNSYPNFYIRLGEDTAEQRTKILTREFILQSKNDILPDVYFNGGDNTVNYIPEDEHPVPIFWERMVDLVGDALLTYQYKSNEVLAGQISTENNKIIDTVSIENIVETIIGPTPKVFYKENQDSTESLLQLFVLNFRRKTEMPKPAQNFNTAYLDKSCLYYTEENNNKTYYMLNDEGTQLEQVTLDEMDNQIVLVDENNISHYFNTIPIISFTNRLYREIRLGRWYCADCAYQIKKVTYKE